VVRSAGPGRKARRAPRRPRVAVAGYVISEALPAEFEGLPQYRALAARSIEKFGGEYVVRGGVAECPEPGGADDEWQRAQIVMIAFPTVERASQWYHSPEYAEALALWPRDLERRLLIVDGTVPKTVAVR